jgi:hypothetical protein
MTPPSPRHGGPEFDAEGGPEFDADYQMRLFVSNCTADSWFMTMSLLGRFSFG